MAAGEYRNRMRAVVSVERFGWTGSSGGMAWPEFRWYGELGQDHRPKLVGEGHIWLEGKEHDRLIKEVVFKDIPDDVDELLITHTPFGDRSKFYSLKRTAGRFVLPEGFHLGEALGIQ